MTDPALEALLAAHVGLLEGAVAVPGPAWTACHLEGFVFAAFAGGVAEFRLGETVSAAALRTPDTKVSARGAGWVRFAPRRLDAHARDRAIAWFESAWRHADAELAGDADEPDVDEDGPDDEDDDEGDGPAT
ncbi:MAG: hypothetical protein P4L30_02785 [Candidatus Limnocylindrales bacterium]|nr:hypothetical protein [Candidatus Limnocylindrales bacterium]